MTNLSTDKKAQLNLEYLFLTLLIIAFLLPLVYQGLQTAYESNRLLSADNLLHDIRGTADNVHKLGPGNKQSLFVHIPKGITGAAVKGKVIAIDIDNNEQTTKLVQELPMNLVGNLPTKTGEYLVPLRAINDNLVRVGEGLELFSLSSSCAAVSTMPQEIMILGDELTGAEILVDGVPLSSLYYKIIDYITLKLILDPSEFQPKVNYEPHLISARKGTEESSSLPIHIVSVPHFCGTLNPTLLLELRDKTVHLSIEDLTDKLSEDEGHYERIQPNELIHGLFQNTMRDPDFFLITARCSRDGTISIYREGTTTVVGSVACLENAWQTHRVYITGTTPPLTEWDLGFSTPTDVDYLTGWDT